MDRDLALRVRGLGKRYTIRHNSHDHVTLAQAALHWVRNPSSITRAEEFWALDEVSFDVDRGEVLGIIGHNGAGKSTLLKVLSRITPPTVGSVEVYGRIGSLLEVGTGFHPELTGRENVYLNGSILGMKRKEIDRQFDAIVDFSGVERFLDTPVKRYSSGMYVRLAFAVAAHLDTEILILDEVLAVGDAAFQKKCLGKMGEVAADGRTVLLVTHSMPLIEELASRAILMDHGRVSRDDDVRVVAEEYRSTARPVSSADDLTTFPRPNYGLTGDCVIVAASARARSLGPSTTMEIHIQLDDRAHLGEVGVVVHVLDSNSYSIGTVILDRCDTASSASLDIAFDVSSLSHGLYGLTLALTSPDPRFGHTNHDVLENVLEVDVHNAALDESGLAPRSWGSLRFDLVSPLGSRR